MTRANSALHTENLTLKQLIKIQPLQKGQLNVRLRLITYKANLTYKRPNKASQN